MSSIRNALLAASVVAAGFGGGLAFAQPAAQLGPQPNAQPPAVHHQQRAERPAPGKYIEGRIAFLKTELKLTSAQQPLFDKLADEMRAGAKTMQERHAQRQQASATPPVQPSALEKLEHRQAMMKEMTAAQDRYLAAFRPFYQSLSPEQKKTADELFAKGAGGHEHRMGGPRAH